MQRELARYLVRKRSFVDDWGQKRIVTRMRRRFLFRLRGFALRLSGSG